MKRTTVLTSGLAVTAALALSGYTVAAGQAATPHQPSARHAGGFSDPATGPVIAISNYTFHAPASVGRGATVTVRNRDDTTHTVTSNSGLFGMRVPANSSRTFKAPGKVGDYHFHCKIHSMHGTLRVR